MIIFCADNAVEYKNIKKNNKINIKIPGFLWDNFTKKDVAKKIQCIDLSFIPEIILTNLNYNMPNYFYYINYLRTKKLIEGFSFDFFIKNDIIFDKYSEEFKELLKEYKLVIKDVLGPNKYIENENIKKWIID